MKTAAVIAEFNPFHNGHRFLADFARKSGVDFLIAIMSGDFTQRGEPAIFDKFTRARTAVENGYDAVFELPTVYATSSAPDFAFGGVSLASSLASIDYLVFGSESGDIEKIKRAASFLENEPEDFKEKVRALQKNGLSYPAALSEAIKDHPEISPGLFSNPNDTLGIEYVRSLLRLGCSITPLTTARYGAMHDSTAAFTAEDGSVFTSSSFIRKTLRESGKKNEGLPIFPEDLSLPVCTALLKENAASLSEYLGSDKDIANRILKLFPQTTGFEEMKTTLCHKQQTAATYSRVLLHMLLDIHPEDRTAPKAARLLALKRESSHMLKTLQDRSLIPIITKPADHDLTTGPLTRKDHYAADLYSLIRANKYNLRTYTPDIAMSPEII
ncbi:MAG: nucleotidyltransferase family protein [Lachnospiraceae bacterium]|nr:nucleotidyltransferase family protein [Lachnospiraceae bacterium]